MKEYQHNHRHPFWNITYFLVKITLGTVIRLIWVRSIEGKEHIPKKGPVIFAFNHQSYFDFFTFISVCPRPVHYLSAEKFFTSMLWRPLMKMTSQIKVDRVAKDKQALHELVHDYLDSGKAIGIFPEGTRSPYEDSMLYAFSGVAKYSHRAKVPVIPVGIKGAHHVMKKGDSRPHFRKAITIHVGKPLYFVEHHSKPGDEALYRMITDEVMREISTLSGKRYEYYGVTERPQSSGANHQA